jgi:hypothetical protein
MAQDRVFLLKQERRVYFNLATKQRSALMAVQDIVVGHLERTKCDGSPDCLTCALGLLFEEALALPLPEPTKLRF